MIAPEVLDALLQAGATAEMIVAALKADSAVDEARALREREEVVARKARQREANADRQRRWRDSNAPSRVTAVSNGDEALVTQDSPPLSPPSPKDPQTPKEPQPPHTPPRATAAHARRLPEDWQPEPLVGESGAAVALWQPGRIERELSKFRDHWRAASGANARKHDWQAAWRNWVLKADETGQRNGHGQPAGLRGSRPDPAVDMLLQAEREKAAGRDQQFGGPPFPALPAH